MTHPNRNMPFPGAGDSKRTWSRAWEGLRDGVNCPACEEGRPDQIPHGRRVFEGRLTDAYLVQNLAALGYTLVFWRGRHIVDPMDLTESETCGFADEVRLVSRGIDQAYRPAKLNYLTLGNSLPHLHTHIVPRYFDDPDPGRPPLFMMADQAWPLMPEAEYVRQLDHLRASIRRFIDNT